MRMFIVLHAADQYLHHRKNGKKTPDKAMDYRLSD